jgi:hypothetical protein
MKIGLLVVALGLALVAAGCGGSDNEASGLSTEDWAEGYCAAIVDWLGELEQATGELSDFRSLSQEEFDQAGGDIRSATETFTAELRGLGAPDTDFGDEARQAVDTFATSAEADLADIEQAAEDVFGGTSITQAITSVTAALTSINKAYTTMFASLREIDREKELQAALEDADSCDELSGS